MTNVALVPDFVDVIPEDSFIWNSLAFLRDCRLSQKLNLIHLEEANLRNTLIQVREQLSFVDCLICKFDFECHRTPVLQASNQNLIP